MVTMTKQGKNTWDLIFGSSERYKHCLVPNFINVMRDWYSTSKVSPAWGHCYGPCRLGFKKPNHRSRGAWMNSGMEWNVHTFGVGVSSSRMLRSPLLLLWKPEEWIFKAQQVSAWTPLGGAGDRAHFCCQMPFPVFYAAQPFHLLHALTSLHWEISAGRVSDRTSLGIGGIRAIEEWW